MNYHSKQLDLFSYENENTGNGMTVWELRYICLYEMRISETEEKRKQWENALKSAEQMIKELEK